MTTGGTGGTGGAGGVVGDCEAELDRLVKQCDAPGQDTQRACFFDKYKGYCTSGYPQAILDSAKCFPTGICWTFADPNTAKDCLIASNKAHARDKATAYRTALCALCPNAPCNEPDNLPPEHLPDALLDSVMTCFQSAATCSQARACLDAAIPELVGCFI